MQSYCEIQPIPKYCANSSQTCMDKRLNIGQIAERAAFSVHSIIFLRKACEDLEVWEKFANFADG